MYFTINDWMIADGLSGSALLVYALIYSYSKDGGEFSGSAEYIAQRTGITRVTAARTLKELETEGKIVRRNVNEKNVNYSAVPVENPVETVLKPVEN